MHYLIGLLSLAMSFWMIATILTMMIFCYRKIEINESYLNDCRCISDARMMWGVRIIYGSMILIGVSSGLLYYFRAPH